jgi:uncharacterized protein YwgA
MSKISDLALLLLLFNYCGEKILGRKRLQKIVCILKYKYKIPFTFSFRRYFYGPYSSELQYAVDTLRAAGLITEEAETTHEGYIIYNYKLTEEGKAFVSRIENKLGESDIKEQLKTALKTLLSSSTEELILLAKQVTPAYQEETIS